MVGDLEIDLEPIGISRTSELVELDLEAVYSEGASGLCVLVFAHGRVGLGLGLLGEGDEVGGEVGRAVLLLEASFDGFD